MTTRTFNEWSSLGYKINKGSKAVGFSNGEPLFTKEQVTLSPRPGYAPYVPKSDEWYEGLPEGYYENERKKFKESEKERKRYNEEYMERYKGWHESYL